METTYTIEFMRLAEPPLAPIKRPSAFHVAYYCNPRVPLINPSANVQGGDINPFWETFAGRAGDCSRGVRSSTKKGEGERFGRIASLHPTLLADHPGS